MTEVGEDQVDVCSAADNRDAGCCDVFLEETLSEDLGAFKDADLAFLELRLCGHLEGNSLGGDDVLQGGTTLLAGGEDGGVHLLGDVGVVGENHTTARATKGLVGCAGDDVGVRHRAGVETCRDETREVGHVHHEVGATRSAMRRNSAKSSWREYADQPATISCGLLSRRGVQLLPCPRCGCPRGRRRGGQPCTACPRS